MRASPSNETRRPANRLAGEKSPYLLQHRFNPVDWRPWGAEAFEAARASDRPVFLSIGYSTCHWCHVMERESFEDEAIARQLNEGFVCVKVDREERPDVDRVYMAFVQAATGQGGWPLTVFLTPGRRPFFGGTYFPPRRRFGRPGLADVLHHMSRAWAEHRAEIEAGADAFLKELEGVRSERPGELSAERIDRAAAGLKAAYDPAHGGFGGAPKFPQPGRPRFLLAHAAARGDRAGVEMVLHTCRRMAAGGLHDQLGGGFARYATDAAWRVPHFEKMLYDNAQLAQLYLDAWLVSGEESLAGVVRSTLDYVLRDLAGPEGEFFSAEDADSEGREGAFYTWTLAEVRDALPAEEAGLAERVFGLTEGGNFVDHGDPDPQPGLNVLRRADERLEPAERPILDAAVEKLRAARARRPRPGRDDKVLASWNGLALGAFARAGAALDEPRYLAAAARNMAFLRRRLWSAERRTLHHRWRDGARDEVQLLSAYAFVLEGALELHQATLEPEPLAFAEELADALVARFRDAERGGFWTSLDEADELVLRLKDDHDGAEPSGAAVAIQSLFRLAAITGRGDRADAARAALSHYAGAMERAPTAWADLWTAALWALGRPALVTLGGERGAPDTRALLRAAHGAYQPLKAIRYEPGPPGARLCIGERCRPPVFTAEELRRRLAEAGFP